MSVIDISLIAVYLLIIFIVGLSSGRYVKTIKEYAVSKQSYSAPVLFATLSASFIGGGFSFGNADSVFKNGLGQATALWGFSLMLVFVALFIAPKIDNFKNCISAGDILEKKYGKFARLTAGILGALVCMGILGAQVGAMGAVFELFTPLSFMQGVIIGCSIVIIYTSFGGMSSVVITDVIQFVLLVLIIPVTLFLGINHVGGIEELSTKIPSDFLNLTNNNLSLTAWISLFLSFLIGETLVPPYVQRLLITKNSKDTVKGTLWSAFLSVPFFLITGAIGLVALAIDANISSNLAMPTVIQTVLPVGLKGLACAAIISIVMSSADSFLNASSVCLVEDVIKPILKRNIVFPKAPARDLILIQTMTLLIGIGSAILAIKISNVLEILRFAYNFWAPVILVPLVAVLIGKKVYKYSFLFGALGGILVITAAFLLNHKAVIFGIDAVVVGTFANFILFSLSNLLAKKSTLK